MSQLNLFTDKIDHPTKKYLTAGKAAKVVIKNTKELANIMLAKGQKPEILGVTNHYILVKPNTMEDLAWENLVLAFKTSHKDYEQAFRDWKLDMYSIRRHLHNQVFYDVTGSNFVILHHKETKKDTLHGARQATFSYTTPFFEEAVQLILSLKDKGIDIASILKEVNPWENMCITESGLKFIEQVKEGETIYARKWYTFPRQISYDEDHLRKICSIPGIKVNIRNLTIEAAEFVKSLLPLSSIDR